MWFIFPQLFGLGQSQTSKQYAIRGLDEAREYLNDPLLSDRLRECTDLVLLHKGRTISQIFGFPDDLKFHACMTLFDLADGDEESEFRLALQQCFAGRGHQQTLELLKKD